jgi:predicted N-acetyltransferase YhbS
MEFVSFQRIHLDGVIGLCAAEGWPSYCADPERTFRALTAPGSVTVVAVDDEKVVGFTHTLTDGAIRAYLANMAVDRERRRQGIGRGLIEATINRLNAVYLDLLAAEGAESFYQSFEHRRLPEYRIHWQAER